jgi:hypothetical protein
MDTSGRDPMPTGSERLGLVLEAVKVIRPSLHHLASLGQIFGTIVDIPISISAYV